MKVAFIYPSISEGGLGSGVDRIFSTIHPGLCYLSASCRQAGFGNLTLLDLRAMKNWKDFEDSVAALRPDVAGMTMMTSDFNNALECARIIKKASPATKVVVGGYHPLIMTEEVSVEKNIDHIVIGEGERGFPELLKSISEKKELPRVFKAGNVDVEGLPFMDRELFNCLETPYDFSLPVPFVTLLAGRGCPYNCRFCAPASKLMHGHTSRRRSVENVIRELEHLRDTYGFKSVRFLDDCFATDKDWTMEFCSAYMERGFRQPFVCQLRADIICRNKEMMRALKRAGLVMACVGFESGSDRILKLMNKGTTTEQNLKAAGICRRLGIKIWAYIMLGLPTETNAEADLTLRMVKRIKPYRSDVAFFTPRPGSYLYDYCKDNGLSLVGDHDDYVVMPELDVPRIKGVDYGHMRLVSSRIKELSPLGLIKKRIERPFLHRARKGFSKKFEKEMRGRPGLCKMAVLRHAHSTGAI